MGKHNSILIFVIILVRAVQDTNQSFLNQSPERESQYSTGPFQNTFKQYLSGLRQGPNPNKQGPPMQQYAGIPAGLNEFLNMQRLGSDHFLEPYWDKGEWVFVRDTFVPRRPRYLALYSTLDPKILKECTEFCPRIYDGYGKLCAHLVSMGTGRIKMKQFQNLCHMTFDNCIKSKTNRHNRDDPWKPLFQGSCHMRWKAMGLSDKPVVKNTKEHLARLEPKEPLVN